MGFSFLDTDQKSEASSAINMLDLSLKIIISASEQAAVTSRV
jgi:hypothetical protein